MSSDEEFYSPLASSTVFKKKKPARWNQEPDSTFHQLVNTSLDGQFDNKENEDCNISLAAESNIDLKTVGDSTMNLWKYIVPAHPQEMEEDSFLAYDKLVEEGLEDLPDELSHLKLSSNSSSIARTFISQADTAPVDSSEIPGYIITGQNVILRRHSSAPLSKESTAKYTRQILSAPPSIVITETHETDQADKEVADLTGDSCLLISSGAPDCGEVEDLVNDSFSKYCHEYDAIDVTGAEPEKVESEAVQSLHSDVTKSTDRGREPVASSNNVPFIDPETSMTTENLPTPTWTPDVNDQSEFSELKDEPASFSNETQEGCCENKSNSIPTELTMNITEEETLQSEHDELSEGNLSENISDGDASDNEYETDIAQDSPSPVKRKMSRHPSFSSPDRYHHSILEKIKEDSRTEKKITFPPAHTVETPCAVGIPRKIPISIENKTDLWVQCSVNVDTAGILCGYSAQNRLIIPPFADEMLPVCLCAKQNGLCLGSVEITVNSVTSGMLAVQHRTCKITAVAEMPGLTLAPMNITFGIQVDNKESTYELRNTSQYDLSLKVLLKSEGPDEAFSLSDPMSVYPTAVFPLTLPAGDSFLGHIEFCPYEDYVDCKATLQVYVDSPGGALLGESDVSGTVGHYKLRIPASQHSLSFQSSPGNPVSQTISFINSGNMATSVVLTMTGPFTVVPAVLPGALAPGEKGECEVCYFPATQQHVTGKLALSLSGDQVHYQIPLEGRCTAAPKPPPPTDVTSCLLANKSIVNFGGVELGQQKVESLYLQNDSRIELMCLEVHVSSSSRSFYIVDSASTYPIIKMSIDMVLPAGSSQTLSLGYSPLHPEFHGGEVLVRCKSPQLSFSIPLTGHGGTSKVSISNAQQSAARLWIDMGVITPRTRNTTRITLSNSGSRPAYVSGILEDDVGEVMRDAWINPTCLVIPEGASREVFIIYEPTKSLSGKNRVALLKLYCGDEISRKRFCKVLGVLSESSRTQHLPFDPTSDYMGERDCETRLPPITQDDLSTERKLFNGGVYHYIISVMGREPPPVHSTPICSAPPALPNPVYTEQAAAEAPGPSGGSRRSLDLYALRKPAHVEERVGSSQREMSERNRRTSTNGSPRLPLKSSTSLVWSFSVEKLVLTKPAVFHVVNESSRPLDYTISQESTLYSVSPHSGHIPPVGCSEITIRPQSSKPFTSELTVSAGQISQTLQVSFIPPQPAPTDRLPHRSSEDNLVKFQQVPTNTSSSSFLEFVNLDSCPLHWTISSVASAYRKVASPDPIRVPYSAFFVSIVKGITAPGSSEKIPVTFYPKDEGNFTQCWSLHYFHGAKTAGTNKMRRFIFEGKSSRCHTSNVSTSKPKDKVFIYQTKLEFCSSLNERQSLSFKIGNPLKSASRVTLSKLHPPFFIKYREVLVESGHSARIPVRCQSTVEGEFSETLVLQTPTGMLEVLLVGKVE